MVIGYRLIPNGLPSRIVKVNLKKKIVIIKFHLRFQDSKSFNIILQLYVLLLARMEEIVLLWTCVNVQKISVVPNVNIVS